MNASYFSSLFSSETNISAGVIHSDNVFVYIEPVSNAFPRVILDGGNVVAIVAAAEPILKADDVEAIADILGIPKTVDASTPSELTVSELHVLRSLVGVERDRILLDEADRTPTSDYLDLFDKLGILIAAMTR